MKPLIQLKSITLSIPGMDAPILSNINYSIYPGDFLVILGSNGSGKSSLLKLMDRRYFPSKGSVYFKEKKLMSYSHTSLSKKIVTLTQNTHDSLFTSLTVLENYLLIEQKTSFFTLTRKKAKLFFADYLAKFNAKLPKKLDQIVDKLSGGEKQALALALSVLYPPEVLLLDEHTSALDPKSADQLMKLSQDIIKQHHITCILTTHDLDIALQYGNRILAMRHGEVYQVIEENEKKTLNKEGLLAACY